MRTTYQNARSRLSGNGKIVLSDQSEDGDAGCGGARCAYQHRTGRRHRGFRIYTGRSEKRSSRQRQRRQKSGRANAPRPHEDRKRHRARRRIRRYRHRGYALGSLTFRIAKTLKKGYNCPNMAAIRPLRRIKIIVRAIPTWLEVSFLIAAIATLLILGGGIIWATFMPIPAITNFENRQVAQSTKIFDRTGNIVLYDVHGTMRRTAVPLDEISPYIQKASIAVEDSTFYENVGFRPLSFMRAAMANVFSGSYAQGGSTITQQVVKNALLTQDKTIIRKIKEIILALRLTRVYTKDQILNTYLNETAYGGTIYGVEEASQYFFGVSAKDVDLAQAAYIAALPQAPTYYSPYGNHRDALDARKNLVLQKMRENNLITQEEYDQATNENVEFNNPKNAGIKAPHFVFFIQEYLEQKYGTDAVGQGGLRVVTTLDYDLQQRAEASVEKFAPGLLKNLNASNQGLVAVDPKTGQILAMVGSKGYFDDTIDGKVNVTIANRQPGSSFKPFVYATAFEKGYTPDTVIFDLPTQFSTACQPSDIGNSTYPCYAPGNFDGGFEGPMKLRAALARSENIPALKLLYLAGIDRKSTR